MQKRWKCKGRQRGWRTGVCAVSISSRVLIAVCQKKHRETLCALTEKLAEDAFPGHSKGHQSFPISSRYVELKVVSDCHFRKPVLQEHEVLEAAGEMHEYRLRKETVVELERITPDRLFRWCARSHGVPLLVMLSGVAGVGKTTLVQKFVFDWARGRHYQKFTFVFFFKFRELSEEKMSLESLLCKTYPDLKDTLNRILQDPEKLLFIFDGLDESRSDLMLSRSGSQGLCTKPRDVKPVGVIVASLLKQTLLKGCSVLLTSRPSKLASLEAGVFHTVASIVGFLSRERERYFTSFFGDDKTSREALAYVRDSQVLYTLCYNPSYCWITCTALQPCFAAVAGKPQPVPKTMTQLLVSYLTHIMTSHSQARPAWEDIRGILARLGWLADYGRANRLLVFDDNYLEAFGVQNSPFLTAFLVENPNCWEPCEVTYSFFHLTLQEFFSALVHYLDYQETNLKCVLDNARSCNEGNYEIFSRFLSGLSHPATRAPLERYLGKFSCY
ncbi:NACHT, LRR and PYD domains-containing protein 12-like [Dromaius novaehollandiae]|uniref:NACHT, LRR and PYD domains-containing protein 12-like n=1 Tax=Dromaius novaehollandiae TaxID=8790 RepID=UPI00311ED099